MEFRVKTSTASKVIGNNLNRNIVEFRENEAEYVCKGAYYLNRNIVEFRESEYLSLAMSGPDLNRNIVEFRALIIIL